MGDAIVDESLDDGIAAYDFVVAACCGVAIVGGHYIGLKTCLYLWQKGNEFLCLLLCQNSIHEKLLHAEGCFFLLAISEMVGEENGACNVC